MLITVAKEAARLDDVCTVITSVFLDNSDRANAHPLRLIAPSLSAAVERALVMDALRIASLLSDPANERNGMRNCSIAGLLQASAIDLTLYPGSAIRDDFEKFRSTFDEIKPTRNKAVAHLDLDALLDHEVHRHFGVDLLQLLTLSSTAKCIVECIAANTGYPRIWHSTNAISEDAHALRCALETSVRVS